MPRFFDKAMDIYPDLISINIFKNDSLKSVDSITGATISSNALKEIIDKSGSEFCSFISGTSYLIEARKPIASQNYKSRFAVYAFIASIIIFLALRKYFQNTYLRMLRLILIFSIFGIYLNYQYSTAEILSLLNGNFSLKLLSRSFIMVILIPMGVFITFNYYCGFLCPFGALQEFLASLNHKFSNKLFPGHRAWKLFSLFKYFLLLFIVLRMFSGSVKSDILQTAFGKNYTALIVIPLIWFLLCSLIYPRFWCRILCPAGAFLSLIRLITPFNILSNKRTPAKCSSGILSENESDCLCCNRCALESSKNLPFDKNFIYNKKVFLFIITILSSILLLIAMITEKEEYVPPSSEKQPVAELPPRNTYKIDKNKYLQLIKEGKLSDKKAMYYMQE